MARFIRLTTIFCQPDKTCHANTIFNFSVFFPGRKALANLPLSIPNVICLFIFYYIIFSFFAVLRQ